MRKDSLIYRVFQYSFYPVIISLTLVASFLMTEYMHHDNYILIPGDLTLIIIMLVVVFEHFFPYREDWLLNKGDVFSDILQTFLVLPFASRLAEFIIPIVLFYPITWFSGNFTIFDFSREWGTMKFDGLKLFRYIASVLFM